MAPPMHEYSIVQALVTRVEEEARARGAFAVNRLRVRIGELSGVEPDLLAAAYELFRERTVCAGAELEIVAAPAEWRCPGCARTIARGEILRCPECGRGARLAGGDEILLERIELAVA
jgi:hydrogenase nickel incorporation protein HypA/HybF